MKNVLRSLDPQAGDFVDVEDVNDVNALKPTITQTYEVGYKGILMNKLAFSADVYHSRINDFVGPLVVETPNVFLDPVTLGASLGKQITVALADPRMQGFIRHCLRSMHLRKVEMATDRLLMSW